MAAYNPFDPEGKWDKYKDDSTIQDIINTYNNAIAEIQEIFKGFTDAVVSSVQGIVDGVTSFVGGVFDGVKSFFGGLTKGITDFFGGLGKGISDFFGGIGDFLGGVWSGIGDFFGGLGQGLIDFLGGVWNGIMDAAKGWYQWLGSVIGDIFGVWMGGLWSIFVQNWYWIIPVTIVGIVAIWYVFFRNTREYPTQFDRQMDATIRMQDHMMKQHETASKFITRGKLK